MGADRAAVPGAARFLSYDLRAKGTARRPISRRPPSPSLRQMNEPGSATRNATAAVLSLRVAYGLALLVAPAKVAGNRWLGPGAAEPAAQVGLRGVGAREVALHGIALAALLRGAPMRPWLAASIAGDLADIGATFVSRDGLPSGSAAATAVVAGGSALASAAAAAQFEE